LPLSSSIQCVCAILSSVACPPPQYTVIQKDGLKRACTNCRRYGLNSKQRLSTRQTVAVFQVLCSLYGFTCVGYAQNSLEFVSRSPLIHVVGRAFAFTQTACLLKLVIPATNALPRWKLNVETKTKRTLHGSRRLSLNELTNAKNLQCG